MTDRSGAQAGQGTRRRWLLRGATVLVALLVGLVALELAVPHLRPLAVAHPSFRRSAAELREDAARLDGLFYMEPSFPSDAREPGRVAIGIYGGSVGQFFGEMMRLHWERVEAAQRFRDATGLTPKVVNLALGGGAQPTQYGVARLTATGLDALVFLDGFNELFIDNPDCATVGATLDATQSDARVLLEPVRRDARLLRSLVDSPAWPLLAESNLARLLLFDASSRINDDAGSHFWRLARHDAEPSPDPVTETRLPRRAAAWEACVEATDALAKRLGRPAWFFLQPNQYVPGSKPIGPEEAAVALRPAESRSGGVASDYAGLPLGYAHLQAAVERLRAKGIRVHSLVSVFAGSSEPYYTDDCCHMNGPGNLVIGERVFERLLEEGPWRRPVQAPAP